MYNNLNKPEGSSIDLIKIVAQQFRFKIKLIPKKDWITYQNGTWGGSVSKNLRKNITEYTHT